MTAKQFSDQFATVVDGVWGKGEPHTELHFPEDGDSHIERVNDIYDKNSDDCCGLMKDMNQHIGNSIADWWRNQQGPDWQGPVQFPLLVDVNDPSKTTNDLLDEMIDRACRDPEPCTYKVPDPVPVEEVVEDPCFWVAVGLGAWRLTCTVTTTVTTVIVGPIFYMDPNDGA